MPLLAKIRRRDDEDAPFALCPFLGNDEACLDGLAEADLVGEQGTLRQGRVERKKRGVDLMRIEIDLRTGDRTGELFRAVGGAALGQLVSEELGVVVSEQPCE